MENEGQKSQFYLCYRFNFKLVRVWRKHWTISHLQPHGLLTAKHIYVKKHHYSKLFYIISNCFIKSAYIDNSSFLVCVCVCVSSKERIILLFCFTQVWACLPDVCFLNVCVCVVSVFALVTISFPRVCVHAFLSAFSVWSSIMWVQWVSSPSLSHSLSVRQDRWFTICGGGVNWENYNNDHMNMDYLCC